ncbi:GTPase HflX [compost metagenome]
MYLESAQKSVSISDTVGFIRDLPHGLVNAFEATLQEAVDADLLLHVVDASNPAHPEQIQQVQKVLREIGADDVPQVLIFNKLDAMDPAQRPTVLADSYELDGVQVPRFFVSAAKGVGLDAIRGHLAEAVLAHQAALEKLESVEIAPDADDELLGNAH